MPRLAVVVDVDLAPDDCDAELMRRLGEVGLAAVLLALERELVQGGWGFPAGQIEAVRFEWDGKPTLRTR